MPITTFIFRSDHKLLPSIFSGMAVLPHCERPGPLSIKHSVHCFLGVPHLDGRIFQISIAKANNDSALQSHSLLKVSLVIEEHSQFYILVANHSLQDRRLGPSSVTGGAAASGSALLHEADHGLFDCGHRLLRILPLVAWQRHSATPLPA